MSFFIVPFAGLGTHASPFVPKYVPALGVAWLWCATPLEWGVVWANASAAQESAIAANADAIVVPPLDNQIALVATQNALEGLGIPSQWLVAGMTYRTVVRVIVGMANFAQRCEGLGQRFALAGNLDKTISQLPVAVRNILATAASSLGLSSAGITGTTTVREALRMMGQQFAAGQSIHLGDL
jgi:hypothetical protein